MRVILFGASGMVGQGVLRECLLDPEVEAVLSIGRADIDARHEKLRHETVPDLFDLSALGGDLAGYDACLYCLGVSAAGMKEPAYRRVTFDLTLSTANALLAANASMTMCFVSGGGTNANSTTMWARVKGEAENALLAMPFGAAYMFRPGFIQPLHGIRSRTAAYRVFYAVFGPLFPIWRRLSPGLVTTTEHVGRAMLHVAKHGGPERVLETAEINRVSSSSSAAS